jgi:hypothetical protein
MNQQEAREILAGHIRELRNLSYSEFCSWVTDGRTEVLLAKGASGTEYQIEIGAMWDSKQGGGIRVLFSIDDGSLPTACVPLCDDFIISPDGSFVGE